jgi:transposase InsO family protein
MRFARGAGPASRSEPGGVAPATASAAQSSSAAASRGSSCSSSLTAGIETACIDPGKPWQNGLDESFNGKFRDECLTLEWFRTRPEAMAVVESWRRHYNDVRPHSSLGQLTPAEFKQSMQRRNEESQPVTQGAIFQ